MLAMSIVSIWKTKEWLIYFSWGMSSLLAFSRSYSMIGCSVMMSSVCLSVRLSVFPSITLGIVALRIGVEG